MNTCNGMVGYGGWGRTRPCTREAVKDGFCTQHHPDSYAKRKQARQDKWQRMHDIRMERARLPISLRAQCDALRYALERANMALTDYYIVLGPNPSAQYNTKQIIADASAALTKSKP